LNPRIEKLAATVGEVLGPRVTRQPSLAEEVYFECGPESLLEVAQLLRDAPGLRFEMLMDLAGVDYLGYGEDEWKTHGATNSGFSRGVDRHPPADAAPGAPAGVRARRFAVVYQLMSITHNERLTLRARCDDSDDPMLDSVCEIWSCANWFEREAFDLFGILFRGHPDLRRILTDYGFIGHPFRKDFPLSGNVEVRYDPERRRVVYEPVSIEPRVLVPRVIRDDNRYDSALKAPKPAA
jgi:NADH-quinone oxidoreductase subunit C